MIDLDSLRIENLPKVDPNKLYLGEAYCPVEGISIKAPDMKSVIQYGFDDFYNMMNYFTANTTSMRVFLWDAGIDWNDITDFQMFCMIVPQLPKEKTKLVFGDLDFSEFRIGGYVRPQEGEDEEPETEPIFHNSKLEDAISEDAVIITEDVYKLIAEACRIIINHFPEAQAVKRKIVKEMYIRDDKKRMETARKKRKNENIESDTLFPLLSFLLNHPGFKYRKDELDKVNYLEFMDSVSRISHIESCEAIMHGMYSGFVDGSKIQPESYDFLKDLRDKGKKKKDSANNDEKEKKEDNKLKVNAKVQEKLKSLR